MSHYHPYQDDTSPPLTYCALHAEENQLDSEMYVCECSRDDCVMCEEHDG